jgi:hypothetical protein
VSVILNGLVLQETVLPICWTGVDGPWPINTATATSTANKTSTTGSYALDFTRSFAYSIGIFTPIKNL